LLWVYASPAQQSRGTIDLHAQREQQISHLEKMVGGDTSARQQSTVLRWLADLYRQNGRPAKVEWSFQRILAFFPGDTGTLNDYADYLLTSGIHIHRADSLLRAANAWERAREKRDGHATDRGKTFTLWGRYALAVGNPVLASRRAERALDYLDERESPGALRVLVESRRRLGAFDEAGRAALRLIGIEGATNRDDINSFLAFVSKTTEWNAGSVRAAIRRAVAQARQRRGDRARAGGGNLVVITSRDGARLEGTIHEAGGPKAVLFIHDIGGSRDVFGPIEQLLFVNGITTLSVDLRGHGASRSDSIPSPMALSDENRGRLGDDIVAAWKRLLETNGVARAHVAVVSIGSSCALSEEALARESGAPTMRAWISPVFAPGNLDLRNALSFARGTVRAIYSDDDFASAEAVRLASRITGGTLERDVLHNAGHGAEMFRRSPDALARLVDWVTQSAPAH